MAAKILGLGTAAPAHELDQNRALELARIYSGNACKPRVLDALYRHSGIRTRGSVVAGGGGAGESASRREGESASRGEGESATLKEGSLPGHPYPEDATDGGLDTGARMALFERHALGLAARACTIALEKSRVKPAEITHLVIASCTGFFAPGLDVLLLKTLKLDPGVTRLIVGFMGCHGAFNALHAADAFARERADARVLVCAVELCTLHMQYGAQLDDLMANALFADGAGAAVIAPNGLPQQGLAALTAFGSQLISESEDAMSWRIGAHGFRMTLSSRVPALIQEHLSVWLQGWLAGQSLKIADIKNWVVHPGGPRILDSVERALELPSSALQISREILSAHGNMSSPTVLFILEKAAAEQALPRPTVMLGFGPGLIVEAVLLN